MQRLNLLPHAETHGQQLAGLPKDTLDRVDDASRQAGRLPVRLVPTKLSVVSCACIEEQGIGNHCVQPPGCDLVDAGCMCKMVVRHVSSTAGHADGDYTLV